MRTIGSWKALSALVLAGGLAAAALFGDARSSQAAPAAQAVMVGMTDTIAFAPAEIVVPAGTTVTWANQGVLPHTVTSDAGVFDSGVAEPQWLGPGAVFSLPFTAPGTYPYVCAVPGHKEIGMVGVVIVQ